MRGQPAQIVRFTLVGVVNTATFYACYLALHPWLPYFAAYTAGYLLSMVGSFFLNTFFTYRTRPSWRKFALFPLTNVTNYLVQSLGLYVLVSGLGANDRTAPLAAAALAVPFTYLLSRRILLPGRLRQQRTAASPSSGQPSMAPPQDTTASRGDDTTTAPRGNKDTAASRGEDTAA